MVAGGGRGMDGPPIESTEALIGVDASSWTLMTPLPSPAKGLTMVSLGNKLYITSNTDCLVSTGVIKVVVGGLGS